MPYGMKRNPVAGMSLKEARKLMTTFNNSFPKEESKAMTAWRARQHRPATDTTPLVVWSLEPGRVERLWRKYGPAVLLILMIGITILAGICLR